MWRKCRKVFKNRLIPVNLKVLHNCKGKLYGEEKHRLVLLLQAMDTAEKDGIIKHVFTSFNPQGVYVASFKELSQKELAHDYLWRVHAFAPKRGEISIFNRSHYEDVVISKVHNLVEKQNLPEWMKIEKIWDKRYEQIRMYEKYLNDNGMAVVKFFLNLSKEEQKKRLIARIDEVDKNWKFSSGDIEERKHWDDYKRAYEKAINETSTSYSPWYIIPADQKWFSRYLVSEIVLKHFEEIAPKFPELSAEKVAMLQDCNRETFKWERVVIQKLRAGATKLNSMIAFSKSLKLLRNDAFINFKYLYLTFSNFFLILYPNIKYFIGVPSMPCGKKRKRL